jgi:hypothetical protein
MKKYKTKKPLIMLTQIIYGIIITTEKKMKSLYLNVEDSLYRKVMDFLRSMPENKINIVEEISCSEELKEELLMRKEEVNRGECLSHDEFWGGTGI